MIEAPSVEETLLAEIVANPDDDGPRLVLADHWSERGDPRGEFVTAQCALAQVDARKPFNWEASDHYETRADELRVKNEVEWLAPFGLDPQHARWSRGFVDQLWAPDLARLMEPLFRQPVRSIYYNAWKQPAAELATLCGMPWPTSLRELCVRANDLDDEIFAILGPVLPRLSSLDLACPVVDAERVAEATSHLSALELSETRLTTAGLARVLAGARLTELNLDDNKLGVGAAEAIAASPHAALLTKLILREPLGGAGFATLADAPLTALRTLLLWKTELGADGLVAIATARGFADLERLGISWDTLGLASIRALARSRLSRLEDLDLGGCPLGDHGAVELATSDVFSNVETLAIYDAQITAAGALEIARSPTLARLAVLEIGSNALGALGTRAGELVRPGLVVLHAGSAQLDDTAVESIARAPASASLSRLSLDQNPFGDHGARALVGSPYLDGLRDLDLEGVELSAETRAALVERFGHRVRFVAKTY